MSNLKPINNDNHKEKPETTTKLEQKSIGLDDLNIEGLEKQKEAYRNTVLKADNHIDVEKAVAEYIDIIEKSFNQPIGVILKKANFVNIHDAALIDRDAGAKALERMKEGASGKTLTEKPKSSQDGIALAGYIPIEQSFSKAGTGGQADRFNHKVAERFDNQKNDIIELNNILKNLNDKNDKAIPQDTKKVIDKILSKNPVAKDVIKTKDGHEVFGLVDDKGNALRSETNEAKFFYKKDGKFFDEKDNSPALEDINPEKNLKKIEVLSYITGVKQGADGKFELKTQKITGDHDQLAIGIKAERGVAIDHGKGDQAIESKKEISGKLGFADDHGIAVSIALIDETKNTGAVRHAQDAGGAGTKGSLNQSELQIICNTFKDNKNLIEAFKDKRFKEIFDQKLGGNPYPEDFADGKYAVYKSGGKISVATNEKTIVEQYNKIEATGHNIDINPRYGWQRNIDNKLEIDPQKISAQNFIKNQTKVEESIKSDNKLTNDQKKSNTLKLLERSERIYKLITVNSLVKLQENSDEKNKTLKVLEAKVLQEEAKFLQTYKTHSPTVEAIVDKDKKEARKTEVSKELCKTQTKKMIASFGYRPNQAPPPGKTPASPNKLKPVFRS